jgi:MoaA/NifB/PqqE/SkfB family radical SAM enzyme
MCNIWQLSADPSREIGAAELEKLPGVSSANVTGGEPFLRDDLVDILSVLRRKARRVVVSTNGHLTDRIVKVARAQPWIGVRVSVEGLPSVNDELRGIKGGFESAICTLTELWRIGLRDIGFGITLSDRNAESLLPLYHLANMMGLEFATAAVHNSFYFHKFDNSIHRQAAVRHALDSLIEELLRSRRPKDWFRAYFNWGLIQYIEGRPRILPCTMGEDACFVSPYGDILPCNGMAEPISFGNLCRQSWEEIWDGAHAKAVRLTARACGRNCWMMGSAAEPIKRHKAAALRWMLARRVPSLSPYLGVSSVNGSRKLT